jgi:ribonuclease P protein component
LTKFSVQQRLRKAAEFSNVFSVRPKRSDHFFLYTKENDQSQARLGLTIGKRLCKHAVRRNLIKRIAREIFRNSNISSKKVDILIRLQKSFDLPNQKISCRDLKRNCFKELSYLIKKIDETAYLEI